MKSECIVTIKRGREKPVLAGHPWIFSGAIKSIDGYSAPGDLCTVRDEKGRFLAKGYANTNSQISVRVLTLEQVNVDRSFLERALQNALLLREPLFKGEEPLRVRNGSLSNVHLPGSHAIRLVNAEGDFLPGLVADLYGKGIVIMALTAGIQHLKRLLMDGLRALFSPAFIYEKVDPQSAANEGIDAEKTGLADGCLHGKLPPAVLIEENGARFLVDIVHGQKTGFYLDQRRNRAVLREISAGRTVLNCFSYTGAFGVQALLGGAASVLNVDTSERALLGARENATLNHIGPDRFLLASEDVFDFLRRNERVYDIVVLDPPKFAGSKAEIPGAVRGYKDINLNALKRVKSGGFLMTFSCSGLVSEDLFRKIVFGAATDVRRRVQIIRTLQADVDHPVNLAHREGGYLKGLLLRVL